MPVLTSLVDTTTLLLGGAIAALSILWWRSTRRSPGIPPGPGPALPLLGHMHLVGMDPRGSFDQWRKKYGDVFSLYFGGRLVIVLNSYDVIREAFVKFADAFSDRPSMFITDEVCRGNGVIATSGEKWKEQRKLNLEILRELGMGKNILAEKIQEEIAMYIKELHSLNGQATDIRRTTQISVSNNICSIVFGKRFEYDDPVFSGYLKRVDENVALLSAREMTRLLEAAVGCAFIMTHRNLKNSIGAAILTFFPWLRFLPGDLFGGKKVLQNARATEDLFIWPQVREHERNHEDGPARDFIHGYIREIRKRERAGEKTTIDVDNCEVCTGDLFVAGTETTSTAISWAVLLFQNFPDVQDKCFQEVNDVIGTGRAPSMRDRPEMTYLEATIMEHTVAYDIKFRGHVIPRDAMVMPNLETVLRDPDIWGDPLNFRPDRFIGPDGKLTRPDEFIPFGVGRRMCLGESLARMELFLYLANLVQHFRLLPPEGCKPPSLERVFGATCAPRPFETRVVPRQ